MPVPLLAAVTLTFADGTGATLRSIPGTKEAALDLSTSPSATLGVTRRTSGYTLGYRPLLSLLDVTRTRTVAVQHYAGFGYSWSMPRLTFTLGLTGSYGRSSYLAAAAQAAQNTQTQNGAATNQDNGTQGTGAMQGTGGTRPGTGQTGGTQGTGAMPGGTQGTGTAMQGGMQATTPTTQYLPQVQVLDTANAALSLGMSYALSRRVGMGLAMGYSMGGGIHGSELYLPFRMGPFAGASLGVKVTRADELGTSLGGGVDYVPVSNSRFVTVNLMEAWTHRFSAYTTSTLGVGATYLQARQGSDGPTTRGVNAAGTAGIARGFKLPGGSALSLSAGASVATTYNPVLGGFYQSVGGGGFIGWGNERVTANAGVTASHGLPWDDPNALQAYGATANTAYQLTEFASLNLNGYWTHQVLPATAVAIYPNLWGATLSLVLVAPPIKF